MGTSHRHIPGVAGEPNWGKASSLITGVANNVRKSEELDKNPPVNATQKQIERKQKTYLLAIARGYHKSVRFLVRAAGGRDTVSRGGSRALGYAGATVANAFVNTFSEISKKGLHNWLHEKGFEDNIGKSCTEILNSIRTYLAVEVVGMDDTAANEALEYVLGTLGHRIDQDANNFDEIMRSTMSTAEIKNIIDDYFGMYVFCHLSQNFREKLEHDKGLEITTSTMEDIKQLIIDDVRNGCNGHSSAIIDWAGEEGKNFIVNEFNKIIYILSGNED